MLSKRAYVVILGWNDRFFVLLPTRILYFSTSNTSGSPRGHTMIASIRCYHCTARPPSEPAYPSHPAGTLKATLKSLAGVSSSSSSVCMAACGRYSARTPRKWPCGRTKSRRHTPRFKRALQCSPASPLAKSLHPQLPPHALLLLQAHLFTNGELDRSWFL
jgi:hypothetical protein